MKFNINVKTVYKNLLKNTLKDIHYIYLSKPKKFVNTNKTIYEVGKFTSTTFIDNDTEIILFRKCISKNNIERLIFNNLSTKFPKYSLNQNYFVGDVEDIADTICDVIKKERKIKERNSISGL